MPKQTAENVVKALEAAFGWLLPSLTWNDQGRTAGNVLWTKIGNVKSVTILRSTPTVAGLRIKLSDDSEFVITIAKG